MSSHIRTEITNHAALGYQVTVAGLTVLGVSLQDWVFISALVVAACQLTRYAWLGWSWLQKRKATTREPVHVPKPAA